MAAETSPQLQIGGRERHMPILIAFGAKTGPSARVTAMLHELVDRKTLRFRHAEHLFSGNG